MKNKCECEKFAAVAPLRLIKSSSFFHDKLPDIHIRRAARSRTIQNGALDEDGEARTEDEDEERAGQ